MGLSPEALRKMKEMGLTFDQAIELAEVMAQDEPVKSARSERNRRYYEKKRLKASEQDVLEDGLNSDAAPFPSSLPPTPPNLTTHTPECVSTRPRKAGDFDVFWEAYPRKTGKDAARKAYFAAVGRIDGPDPPGVLLAALERVKATWDDAQYIPHPRTWLSQGRWQDEPTVIQLNPRQANGPHNNTRTSDREDRLGNCFEGLVGAVNERR
jgi:hypothetical protein